MTLEEYMTEMKLSQKEAAKKFGVSISMISRLLAKERKPGYAMRQLIKTKTKGSISIEDWQ